MSKRPDNASKPQKAVGTIKNRPKAKMTAVVRWSNRQKTLHDMDAVAVKIEMLLAIGQRDVTVTVDGQVIEVSPAVVIGNRGKIKEHIREEMKEVKA